MKKFIKVTVRDPSDIEDEVLVNPKLIQYISPHFEHGTLIHFSNAMLQVEESLEDIQILLEEVDKESQEDIDLYNIRNFKSLE